MIVFEKEAGYSISGMLAHFLGETLSVRDGQGLVQRLLLPTQVSLRTTNVFEEAAFTACVCAAGSEK